jgi:hypothetical protein
MVIVKLKGGLGNQMFEYSAGLALALKERSDLKLDLSNYPKEAQRKFGLDVFNISGKLASPEEITSIIGKNEARPFTEKIFGKILNKITGVLRENHSPLDKRFFKAKSPIYIEGYWQSERYFKDFEIEIKKEFTLKKPLSKKALDWLEIIETSSSISVHVRRYDFVINKSVNSEYGTYDSSYYNTAIKLIQEKEGVSSVFIFSDDIPWCKKNIHQGANVHFVSDSGLPDTEEMILMSKCKNHVISNSTFGWWGAYLGNSSSIVIAPKHWFKNPTRSERYIVPDRWIRI